MACVFGRLDYIDGTDSRAWKRAVSALTPWLDKQKTRFIDANGVPKTDEPNVLACGSIVIPCGIYPGMVAARKRLFPGATGVFVYATFDRSFIGGVILDGEELTFRLEDWIGTRILDTRLRGAKPEDLKESKELRAEVVDRFMYHMRFMFSPYAMAPLLPYRIAQQRASTSRRAKRRSSGKRSRSHE